MTDRDTHKLFPLKIHSKSTTSKCSLANNHIRFLYIQGAAGVLCASDISVLTQAETLSHLGFRPSTHTLVGVGDDMPAWLITRASLLLGCVLRLDVTENLLICPWVVLLELRGNFLVGLKQCLFLNWFVQQPGPTRTRAAGVRAHAEEPTPRKPTSGRT